MPFLGMRGTGDWAENQRPENWRESILYLYPNGSAPLTAILSMFRSQSTDDPIFHWFTKTLPQQAIDATGIFTDVGLANAVTAQSYPAGTTLYIKGAADQVGEFRVGHEVLIRDSDDYRVDTVAEVTGRSISGANSYIAVILRQASDATQTIDDADRVLVIGNVNAEGATMPNAISYDPDEFDNQTQIFRTPLEITRTARKTRLRTGDAYKELKREALELHSIEMEKAFIWGIRYTSVGDNGKPKRATNGILNGIYTHASQNVDDYRFNTTYAGDTWLEGGEDWFEEQLETIFRYGNTEKLVLCGTGALRGINRLAKAGGQINLEPMTTDYGLQVVRWLSPFGTLWFKLHPLFSHEPSNRNSMLFVEPDKLMYRYVDDTFFVDDPEDKKNRNQGVDGTKEEFLTECGLEQHHFPAFAFLNGVGLDNGLTP